MMELLDLMDDVLVEILTHCSIETVIDVRSTCRRLKSIIEKHNLPKIKEYESYDASPRSPDKPIIKCIGKHLRKLSVTFHKEPLENVNDFCEFLAKNVGTNIRNLEIVSDGQAIPPLELLAPILSQLDTLKLSFSRQAEDSEDVYWPTKKTYDVNLAVLCPNLQKIFFRGMHRFPPYCSSFRRLKSLTVHTYRQYNSEIDIFLDNNPQLTEITIGQCDSANEYVNFDSFTQNLANLEKLCISMNLIKYGTWSPQMFGRLQKLQTLRLNDIRNNFNEILENLLQLKQLTSISMNLTSSMDSVISQQTLVQLAKELENLQLFCIWHPLDVFWNQDTVIDFVRFSSKLKAVYVQHFNFECTSQFLKDLVAARKISNETAEPLVIATNNEKFQSKMKEAGAEVQAERYLKYETLCSSTFRHCT